MDLMSLRKWTSDVSHVMARHDEFVSYIIEEPIGRAGGVGQVQVPNGGVIRRYYRLLARPFDSSSDPQLHSAPEKHWKQRATE